MKIVSGVLHETNLNGPIFFNWTWIPQGMYVRRMLDCKLFAEDVVVSRRGSQE